VAVERCFQFTAAAVPHVTERRMPIILRIETVTVFMRMHLLMRFPAIHIASHPAMGFMDPFLSQIRAVVKFAARVFAPGGVTGFSGTA